MITPGIAIGSAVVWAPAGEPVPRSQALAASVPAERLRLEQALRRTRRELEETARRVAVTVGESAAAIFAAHLQLLHDPGFSAALLQRIEVEHLAAESAVDVTVEAIARRFAAQGC
jgi:phosphotransferase system enzyme I (PtsI)